MNTTAARPRCVHCGAKYGRRATHGFTLCWQEGEPEEVYGGYLQLVKSETPRKRGDGAWVRHIEVWDGKSWIGGYEPFCTLRCALSYARRAYNNRKGA
jgi:hypothetical protein